MPYSESLKVGFQSYMDDFPLTQENLKKSILDVGAGECEFIQYVRDVLNNKNAFGVDSLDSQVNSLKEGLLVANGFNLSFENETFDIVLAHNYLPVFTDDFKKTQSAIIELLRVTKLGGKMMGDIHTLESLQTSDRQIREILGENYSQEDLDLHNKKILGTEALLSFLDELSSDDRFEIDIVDRKGTNILIIIKK